MRALANLLALMFALMVCTVFFGWWTVPIVSFGWTLASPRRAAVIYSAFAGAVAWGALLLWLSRASPIGEVDALLTQIMGVPANSLIALTLAYAALLAGSAALIAQSLRPPPRSRV